MLGLEDGAAEAKKKPGMDAKEIMKKRREKAICIVSRDISNNYNFMKINFV